MELPGNLSAAVSAAQKAAQAISPNVIREIQRMNEVMQEDISRSIAAIPVRDNPAMWTYKRLKQYIVDFEKELDDQHEIGARLVSFGEKITFHIVDIGYWGPDIVSFDGALDNGDRVQLIQNIAQLSVLLVAMKKAPDQPARRIGFNLQEQMEPKG